MVNFTSDTYQMKREILTFSYKISKHLSKSDRKFTADMTCGMLVSGSCLLTDIVDQLHEDSKKVNTPNFSRSDKKSDEEKKRWIEITINDYK